LEREQKSLLFGGVKGACHIIVVHDLEGFPARGHAGVILIGVEACRIFPCKRAGGQKRVPVVKTSRESVPGP
jgi:hypothetical protein